MKASKTSFLVAVLALLGTAVACSGPATLRAALVAVSEDELAIMVLPREDLGEYADGLEVDPFASGLRGHQDGANDYMDPAVTANDVAARGRESGYALFYGNSDPFAAFQAGETFIVGTEVELWLDSDAAGTAVEQKLNGFRRYEGEVVGNMTFTLEEFDVSGIGQESRGLRFKMAFVGSDFTLYRTTVYVRFDRLIASASIISTDDESMDAQTEEIARKLGHRIRGVVEDNVTGSPVPVPSVGDE